MLVHLLQCDCSLAISSPIRKTHLIELMHIYLIFIIYLYYLYLSIYISILFKIRTGEALYLLAHGYLKSCLGVLFEPLLI